jgi:hypothetical protein
MYKENDTRLDRTVASKILSQALAADPQFRERFDRKRAPFPSSHIRIFARSVMSSQHGTAFLVKETRASKKNAAKMHTPGRRKAR